MHTTGKLISAVVVTVIVVVAGMLVLWKIADNKPLLPDRAPENIEENAVITDTEVDKEDTPFDSSGVSLSYTKNITIDLTTGTATLHFENPKKSLYDASIILVVQDTVVLQSGLLPPGSLLKTLSLPEEGVPLQKGSYDASILVQFYDESGMPMSVNAKIDGVVIEVK